VQDDCATQARSTLQNDAHRGLGCKTGHMEADRQTDGWTDGQTESGIPGNVVG